jgi:hypothetical protein
LPAASPLSNYSEYDLFVREIKMYEL